MTRLFHPPELERSRERNQFDPTREGERYGLSRELLLAIWERVCADTTDTFGRRMEVQARERFHELAARIAARGGRPNPDPGRVTRVELEMSGDLHGHRSADELSPRAPGRETLVIAEAQRWARTRKEPALASERGKGETRRHELPGASEVDRALAALLQSIQPRQATQSEDEPRDQTGIAAHAQHGTDLDEPALGADLSAGHEEVGGSERTTDAGSMRSARDLWRDLDALYTTGGAAAVQTAVQALDPDPRIRVGALLGVDLSFVRFERGGAADQFLDEIAADGAAVGATVYLRPGLSAEERWALEAHELTHVAQTKDHASLMADEPDVAPPDSAVEQEAELIGQQLAAFMPLTRPLTASAPAGTVLRGKGKIIGWIVKVGERKLIKTAVIYSEKELAALLAKGFNVLVRDGRQVAKRIAKKVWGDEVLHHTGHIIKKTGKLGLSHFQPLRHGVGRAGEKGWHIFYSALPVLFFSEDADALAIYEDKYPGKSIANYLTITQYAGEDSWLSYLDWINPLDLVATAGDIGRDWDRERTKELKSLIFTREGPNGTIQTYELNPEGELVKVYVKGSKGETKEFTAEEYHELLGNAAESLGGETDPPAADGTTDPNYAGTFDADFRIYYSKQGWNYVSKTLSFFLPADAAANLSRVGSFYVNYNERINYLYVLAHPTMRSVLRQPGFKIPRI